MKEVNVSSKVVAALNEVFDCRAKKRHSGRFGSGDPDIFGVFRGTAFFIEMKMLGGALTALQADELERWREAGARTFIGIYNAVEKKLALIGLDHNERWTDFASAEGVRALYESSHTQKASFKEFAFDGWLETNVAMEFVGVT